MRNGFLIILLFVLLFQACKPKKNNEKNEAIVHSSEFLWKGDSLGNIFFENSAIIIPVEPEKVCSRKTYLQLQAGVSQHYIYEDFIDSSFFENTNIDEPAFLFSGDIGDYHFDSVQMPLVFRQYSAADSLIGCVGFDFFNTKQVLLNFKNQSIQFADKFETGNSSPIPYTVYLEHKLLIPVSLNGREVMFLCNPLSPLYVVFNHLNVTKVEVGGDPYSAPNTQVIDDANPAFQGILGHAFFKDKRLIVDTENQEVFILD
ncbi:MAG: hypothetical protein U9N51_05590 [Bacteroidota bacterium]|nr:hypothetical protein [Bacteroidota bacterium]